MEAKTQYTDYKGTVAADISDHVATKNAHDDSLASIGIHYGLDPAKYKTVGLKVYGRKDFSIELICVDIEASKENDVLIGISLEDENALQELFKRFEFVLYDKYDEKYKNMDLTNSIKIEEAIS